jgi:hypothetical protein
VEWFTEADTYKRIRQWGHTVTPREILTFYPRIGDDEAILMPAECKLGTNTPARRSKVSSFRGDGQRESLGPNQV